MWLLYQLHHLGLLEAFSISLSILTHVLARKLMAEPREVMLRPKHALTEHLALLRRVSY